MVLRPLLLTRCLNVIGMLVGPPFLFIGVFGGILAPLPEGANGVVGVIALILAAGCLCLAVRAWRLAVVCLPDRIIVRGYLRSRTVPMSRVIGITDDGWPSLRWHGPMGGTDRMLVMAFVLPYRTVPFVKRHVNTCKESLTDWISRHQ